MKILIFLGVLIFAFAKVSLASEVDPDLAQLKKAEVELKSGNEKFAIKLYKKVYSKSKTQKQSAILALVGIYTKAKRFEDAIDFLKSEIEENLFAPELKIQLAEVYDQSGDAASSLKVIERAEKIIGPNDRILKIKFRAQQKLNQHQDAILSLNQYIKNNPNDHEALVRRAESHYELTHYEKASEDAAAAYAIQPTDQKVLSLYTKLAWKLQNVYVAERIGSKCAELFPENASCQLSLANTFFDKKDYRLAVEHFQKAFKSEHPDKNMHLRFAEALALANEVSASDKEYKKILSENPTFEPAMRSWYGFLQKRHDVQTLAEALQVFCENKPENIWSAFELYQLYSLVGYEKKSLKVMKKTLDENKSDLAQFYYAYTLNQSNQLDKSIEHLEKIQNENLNKDYHLGLVYSKLGKTAEAIKYWTKVKPASSLYTKAQLNLSRMSPVENRKPANDIKTSLSPFPEWELPPL